MSEVGRTIETYACHAPGGPLRASWIMERVVLPLFRRQKHKDKDFIFQKFLGVLYVTAEPKLIDMGMPILEREPWRTGRLPTPPVTNKDFPMLDTLSRAALIAAIILALGVLVAGLTGCVTSPEPHPPVTCTPVEFCDTTVVYPGIGEAK